MPADDESSGDLLRQQGQAISSNGRVAYDEVVSGPDGAHLKPIEGRPPGTEDGRRTRRMLEVAASVRTRHSGPKRSSIKRKVERREAEPLRVRKQ